MAAAGKAAAGEKDKEIDLEKEIEDQLDAQDTPYDMMQE